jgi:hypothetical protein
MVRHDAGVEHGDDGVAAAARGLPERRSAHAVATPGPGAVPEVVLVDEVRVVGRDGRCGEGLHPVVRCRERDVAALLDRVGDRAGRVTLERSVELHERQACGAVDRVAHLDVGRERVGDRSLDLLLRRRALHDDAHGLGLGRRRLRLGQRGCGHRRRAGRRGRGGHRRGGEQCCEHRSGGEHDDSGPDHDDSSVQTTSAPE